MGRNANELAMRNAALASLMGVSEADFGYDYSDVTGGEDAVFGAQADFGVDIEDYGYNVSDPDLSMSGLTDADFGAGVDLSAIGAAANARAAAAAAHPAVQAIVAKHAAGQMKRAKRLSLINPNAGSDVKVGRYKFAVNTTITALGTAGAISGSNSPDVHFRPERITCNVVSPGMVTLNDARIANVSFIVGGNVDAWDFNANSVDQLLGTEPMTPANKATFSGSYTGLTPSPLSGTGTYGFVLSLAGPATIVG